nr:TIGR01906 family membrane protein [Lactococcus fujiensis]
MGGLVQHKERSEAVRDKFIFTGSILWIIATSVIVTILLAIPLFGLEIPLYHLTEAAQMSGSRLWHNFLVLMNYLLNPFIGTLKMPVFPSSTSGLKHFSEVKHLFMFALSLVVLLFPLFVLFIKDNLRIVFHNGLRFMMWLPILISLVAFLIGFDQFFLYFHEVLFRDNTWLFDPAKDPIIDVLPEQYFMHTFLIFAIVYEAIFYGLYRKGYSRIKRMK